MITVTHLSAKIRRIRRLTNQPSPVVQAISADERKRRDRDKKRAKRHAIAQAQGRECRVGRPITSQHPRAAYWRKYKRDRYRRADDNTIRKRICAALAMIT